MAGPLRGVMQTGVVKLMVGVFALVLLVLVDQWKFQGHYTRETARVTRYVMAHVGH